MDAPGGILSKYPLLHKVCSTTAMLLLYLALKLSLKNIRDLECGIHLGFILTCHLGESPTYYKSFGQWLQK